MMMCFIFIIRKKYNEDGFHLEKSEFNEAQSMWGGRGSSPSQESKDSLGKAVLPPPPPAPAAPQLPPLRPQPAGSPRPHQQASPLYPRAL